jgi:hypothetical protein
VFGSVVLVLGMVAAVHVDVNQVSNDRFDDLTVTQFENTDNDDRPLTVEIDRRTRSTVRRPRPSIRYRRPDPCHG